jgi:hypothetical protein
MYSKLANPKWRESSLMATKCQISLLFMALWDYAHVDKTNKKLAPHLLETGSCLPETTFLCFHPTLHKVLSTYCDY